MAQRFGWLTSDRRYGSLYHVLEGIYCGIRVCVLCIYVRVCGLSVCISVLKMFSEKQIGCVRSEGFHRIPYRVFHHRGSPFWESFLC